MSKKDNIEKKNAVSASPATICSADGVSENAERETIINRQDEIITERIQLEERLNELREEYGQLEKRLRRTYK